MKRVILSWALGWLMFCGCSVAADEPSTAAAINALKSADPSTKIDAINQLASLKAKAASAVGPLIELLKDPSPEVRANAASALGEIGEPAKSAAPALIELLKDENPVVRREAIQSVIEIKPGPQVTVPLCIKSLEESSPQVQVRILNAISEAGAAAVPGLIEALKNDKAAYWACLVARDLGPVAKEAIPGLTARLADPRPQVRREAALALAAMESAAAPAIPELAKLVSDEHAAAAATYALGRIGNVPADVESKIQANAKGNDKMLGTTSLWALGILHPIDTAIRTDVTERLIANLKESDPYVRAAAARALASLPPAPEITVPIFEKALADGDEVTVQHALDALAALGGKSVPRLIEGLKHEKLRTQIAYVLMRIGPDAAPATEALAGLVNDKNEDAAEAAAMALAAIGPGARAAVPALAGALEQPNQPNAHAIVYALSSIGPDAATAEPALSKRLGDKDANLAIVSARALAKIKPSPETAAKVVPVLTAGLANEEPVMRRAAAESLGTLGPLAKGAASALEKATKDADKSVSDAATKALAAVKG